MADVNVSFHCPILYYCRVAMVIATELLDIIRATDSSATAVDIF